MGSIADHVDVFEPARDDSNFSDMEKRASQASAQFPVPQAMLDSFMARKWRFISEQEDGATLQKLIYKEVNNYGELLSVQIPFKLTHRTRFDWQFIPLQLT